MALRRPEGAAVTYTHEFFEVDGREFCPTGQDETRFEVWSTWRRKMTLILTVTDLDTQPRFHWEPGWFDNDDDWKRRIEQAALKSRREAVIRACE